MKLCPIAIVAGCKKCPAFKICPLKGVIGDQDSGQSSQNKNAGQHTPPAEDSSTTKE